MTPDPPADSSYDRDAAPHYEDETTVNAWFAQYRPANRREDIEEAPFWSEVIAFNQMPQTLIDEYQGKYVAVYGGNIVDADADEAELALRFYRTFGYVSVYIHKVGTEDGIVDTSTSGPCS